MSKRPLLFVQDFLKEVDIRFMDQLRRGTSIVAADLARDPPPASLKEAYHLVCLTGTTCSCSKRSVNSLCLQPELCAAYK